MGSIVPGTLLSGLRGQTLEPGFEGPQAIGTRFEVARAELAELAVFDHTGRGVRTLHAGTLAPGRYARTRDGRTDGFSNAPSGLYLFMLNTAERMRSERVAWVRSCAARQFGALETEA